MPRRPARLVIVRLLLAAGVVALLAAGPAAGAEVEGPCTASFNGVDASRIDSLDSPLELTATDVLTFHGTDPDGTQSARVEMIIGMVTVRDGSATYGPLQTDFTASLDLDDVSPYGVGLFRVRGHTDHCVVEAWVRVSGRFPFATLTGLTAGGLALGGFAAQVTAIANRRRRSALAAALGGVVTGAGAAGIAQQYGRLQLSIPSVAIVAGAAAVLGAVLAWLASPRTGPGWIARRRQTAADRRAIRYQARLEAARLDAERRETEAAAARTSEPLPEPEPLAEPEPLPEPEPEPLPEPEPEPEP
ncbi:MAG: hypothetical protein KQH83_11950, partial [Actinobacteria bacterium]|nr:hypothetical protein [Actinomycetota bacterium]